MWLCVCIYILTYMSMCMHIYTHIHDFHTYTHIYMTFIHKYVYHLFICIHVMFIYFWANTKWNSNIETASTQFYQWHPVWCMLQNFYKLHTPKRHRLLALQPGGPDLRQIRIQTLKGIYECVLLQTSHSYTYIKRCMHMYVCRNSWFYCGMVSPEESESIGRGSNLGRTWKIIFWNQ